MLNSATQVCMCSIMSWPNAVIHMENSRCICICWWMAVLDSISSCLVQRCCSSPVGLAFHGASSIPTFNSKCTNKERQAFPLHYGKFASKLTHILAIVHLPQHIVDLRLERLCHVLMEPGCQQRSANGSLLCRMKYSCAQVVEQMRSHKVRICWINTNVHAFSLGWTCPSCD